MQKSDERSEQHDQVMHPTGAGITATRDIQAASNGDAPCPTCSGAASGPVVYVYAIGQIEAASRGFRSKRNSLRWPDAQ